VANQHVFLLEFNPCAWELVADFYALRKDVELAVERVDEVRQAAGLEQLVEEIASLESKSGDSTLWDDPSKAQELLVALTEVKEKVKLLNDFKLQVRLHVIYMHPADQHLK
jgi:hypothetical protein